MTCPTCEKLKERIRDLELQIGYADTESHAKLTLAYGITPNEAGILMHLYHAKGRPRRSDFLHANRVHQRTDDTQTNHDVKVYISRMRKKLGADIITTTMVGYLLSASGRELVDRALTVDP